MKAPHILVAAVSVLGVLAGSADAQLDTMETTFVHVRSVEIDSTVYNVYDMIVTQGTDWYIAMLDITLTSGSFYNHSIWGTDTEPSPDLFGTAPELEWDTYAATPAGWPDLAKFTHDPQFGQNPDTTDPPMGNTAIKAGWYDTADTAGTFSAARLTLSSDAAGTIGGANSATNLYGPGHTDPYIKSFDGMYFIEGGHIVPEPATLALLGLGGLSVLRRRSAQVMRRRRR